MKTEGDFSLELTVRPVDISIIVPTFNECGNVMELVKRVAAALAEISWEIIFVDDDSPDGTAAAAWRLSRTDPRVRCIRRIGRRGLASACIEGMLSSNAKFFAVMDADLQHDPVCLARMHEILAADEADLVIGSRYAPGGSVDGWDEKRLAMSRFATRLARAVTHQPLSDPMSGFFALKREVFEDCVKNLSSIGFKILLDIVASSRKDMRIVEIPFVFSSRLTGESKLNTNVMWEYMLLILDKLFGKYIPVRFIAFAGIGVVGIVVHFLTLGLMHKGMNVDFPVSQGLATMVAIVFNFTLNNLLTYADSTLRGLHWIQGLLSFLFICGIGAAANVGIASYLFSNDLSWAAAALAGIALSAVWNYAVTARYTWSTSS